MYGNNALGIPLLTLVMLVPTVGAAAVSAVPSARRTLLERLALFFAVADLLLVLVLLGSYNWSAAGFQLVDRWVWAPSLGLSYYLGVDGLSVWLVPLTSLLSLIAVAYSGGLITDRVREYYAALLVLETGMLGVFLALDLSLFYVFFEVTLIPMALLIGVWGHGRKLYSAVKFFLYTLAGSLLMLAAIVAAYVATGTARQPTLSYPELAQAAPGWTWGFQMLMFWGFFFAFAIKTPLFPFHTWLPDAHVDAPTAGSVILAGVLLKMGGYGFLRWLLPLSPQASRDMAAVPITLSVIAILYGAYVTLMQRDLKKLVAYSSVASMGFVVLGIFTFTVQGVQGAIAQMVSHGLISGGLFLGVGAVYERLHTREIRRLGGLATRLGTFTAMFVALALGNLGLPGLSAFVGEVLVTLAAFQLSPWLAAAVYAYIILSAAYMLWMVARVFYLGAPSEDRPLPRLDRWREGAPLLTLVLLSVLLGVWSRPFLDATAPAVNDLLARVGSSVATGTGPLP